MLGRAVGARGPLSVFIPACIIWAIVSIPPYPWFGNHSILNLMLYWSTSGLLNGASSLVFPFTLASAIASFLLAFLWLNRAGLDRIRCLLLAASFPFAFTGSFEVAYQYAFLLVRPNLFSTDLIGAILLASWVFLGFSTIRFWQASRKFYLSLSLLMVSFGVWLAVGYPQVYIPSEWWLAYPFNVATKILFALLFLTLLYDGTRTESRKEQVKPKAIVGTS